MNRVGRFAPSTTGHAHPGTLLAALLCWCDARQSDMQVRLRLEDLDPERCKPEYQQALRDQLAWFGLRFDAVDVQSANTERHVEALDKLADMERLYACTCSRAQLRAHGVAAPDGGWAYPNTCRAGAPLSRAAWRQSTHPLRARLDDAQVSPVDVGGTNLTQNPAHAMGDPIVRRRDGAIAYQLAVVVDDAATHVTHIVRGRDIAPSTATQVALMRLLNLREPTYRHHFLICEPRGEKFAKLHGAVSAGALQPHYTPEALCGFLAYLSGLRDTDEPITPASLCDAFSWARVSVRDQLVSWNGTALLWHGPVNSASA